MSRDIREVCEEALHLLRDKHGPGDMISVNCIDGYFVEILSILNENSDDLR